MIWPTLFVAIIAALFLAPYAHSWLRRRARIRQDRRNYESLLEKAHRELRGEQQ